MKKAALLLFIVAGFALAQVQEPGAVPPAPPAAEQAKPPANVPATAVVAQTQSERTVKPSVTDLNCSGFVTTQPVNRGNRVGGGWHTPHTTKFNERDTIYLEGSGYKEGEQVYLVRELRDPNQYELFQGQHKMAEKMGQPFADLGRARIIAIRDKVAIALVEFSCEQIVPGDIALPFFERPQVTYISHAVFDRFPPFTGKASGRILMAKDFDLFLGTGGKVYLNVGSSQGVKPGDVFRAMRSYNPKEMEPTDALSFKASTTEDTQKNQLAQKPERLRELPRRALGELVVLNVTPSSATAMITFALEDIHVGDPVEMVEAVAH